MEIEIQFTNERIVEKISPPAELGAVGAWIEFCGIVRDSENGGKISLLEYEAYPEMAMREIRRLLEEISAKNPCLAARVIHRVGMIPVAETAIYVGVASKHRGEAIALLAEFMDRLKHDVPIWKRRAIAATAGDRQSSAKSSENDAHKTSLQKVLPLDDAVFEIHSRCQPLPAIRVSLEESFDRVLRETICAPEDLPPFDCSTRDGFAILQNDSSESFQVVDTIHAADWKPRQLKSGEALKIATGAPLPCENLRVVMQENADRSGDKIQILRRENSANIRLRGEEMKAGQILLRDGSRINAGVLALLATAGCTQPLVNPRLRVCHFTTGDEIIPPSRKPKPGQIRDSNSVLIRGLLQKFSCDLEHAHLPENFEIAKSQISNLKSRIENADLVLISGGASVGEKDFTRPLLGWLGFDIIFSQIDVRPGRPLIFGMSGKRVAFGLPGNPLSHFVCFHLFVARALAKLIGEAPKNFLRGKLASKLDDKPCPRETFWPARLEFLNGELRLHPLKWSSSGDITCLTETTALIRVPTNRGSIESGAEVEFLPA